MDLFQQVIEACLQKGKIAGIKLYRDTMRVELLVAKHAVDSMLLSYYNKQKQLNSFIQNSSSN